jgi:hypothetical protein
MLIHRRLFALARWKLWIWRVQRADFEAKNYGEKGFERIKAYHDRE